MLILDWRQKSSARSQLKLAIEDVLDTGLPRACDKPLYEQKCSALFEHIYESYPSATRVFTQLRFDLLDLTRQKPANEFRDGTPTADHWHDDAVMNHST